RLDRLGAGWLGDRRVETFGPGVADPAGPDDLTVDQGLDDPCRGVETSQLRHGDILPSSAPRRARGTWDGSEEGAQPQAEGGECSAAHQDTGGGGESGTPAALLTEPYGLEARGREGGVAAQESDPEDQLPLDRCGV